MSIPSSLTSPNRLAALTAGVSLVTIALEVGVMMLGHSHGIDIVSGERFALVEI